MCYTSKGLSYDIPGDISLLRLCDKIGKLLQTVAIDPRYGLRKTREFASGSVAGQLLLTSKVETLDNERALVRIQYHTSSAFL